MSAPVVTGIGVVSPNGIGVDAYWKSVLTGSSGIGEISRFETDGYASGIGGEIKGFEPAEHLPSRLIPQTDHMTRLALIAAERSLADAGLDPKALPDFSVGVVTAASAGGMEFGQREMEALWSKGGAYVSSYQAFAWFYPVNTGQISIRHGLRGASSAVVTEQAGGLDAVAKARRHIDQGTPHMLAGGVDSALCPWGWLCMSRSGRVSTVADPERAYLPFDADASGHVPGEGGALLVLEDPQAAEHRGAHQRYGSVVGYASTFDPRPGSGREPGLRRAVEAALDQARIGAGDIDVVFADASGVPELDRQEAEALSAVFGPRGVPVTAPKSMTGRLLAGGASLDLATALLALRDQVVPPTVNVTAPAFPDLIDLVVDQPQERPLTYALVVARGYGGFNSVMVVRR
ncbi:ketosynthase chain-length factor [Streptomyces sp. TRM68416]|uniref:ketosynthase chain-length factor n=1 Tax=Streptomyces sp. TRM68416 TaxID=2758412 RepID=UPI001661FD6D|nr:ketosynthase chain-length factor [Streptomyces sp. TRM68416]MBD0842338.1 ketosynthase chain-length factor [Streptomyces sp. TRM68416]